MSDDETTRAPDQVGDDGDAPGGEHGGDDTPTAAAPAPEPAPTAAAPVPTAAEPPITQRAPEPAVTQQAPTPDPTLRYPVPPAEMAQAAPTAPTSPPATPPAAPVPPSAPPGPAAPPVVPPTAPPVAPPTAAPGAAGQAQPGYPAAPPGAPVAPTASPVPPVPPVPPGAPIAPGVPGVAVPPGTPPSPAGYGPPPTGYAPQPAAAPGYGYGHGHGYGAAPAPGYPAAPPYPPVAGPPTGAYPPAYGAPGAAPARRVDRGQGSRRALLGVAVVFAVLAAGFAVVNLRATPTGAGTPEQAVERFFDAVADEDLIGVLEMLDPGEREVLVPFVRQLSSELDRLEITSGLDPDDVDGFDIEVTDLEVRPQELGPGVAEVAVTGGTFRFATVPEAVPVGDVLRDIIEANGGEIDIPRQQDQTSIRPEDDLFLVTTEHDGRWHLSLGFTIAEYARRDAGLDFPDLDGGVQPQGAPSAEAAVEELVEAVAAFDAERVISLLPPDELRALQVYAPLFLDDIQDELDDLRDDEDLEITVDRLDVETRDIDGGTRVIPTGGSITLEDGTGETTLSYDDGCFEVTGAAEEDFEDEFGDTRVCTDDLAEGRNNGLSEEDEADLAALGALFADFEPGVVAVERGGEWYVDPFRTLGDLGTQVLAGIEKEDLEEGGILYRLLTGELFDSFGYEDYEDFEIPYDDCEIFDSDVC